MRLSDLAQTLALIALLENSSPVDIERPPADVPPFQPGAAHSCRYPFDDEIPFEFCDGADDDHDGPSERGAGIKILAEADELDVEMVEFVEHLEEVSNGPGDPVRGPYQQHLEAAAACVPKELIETRATSLRPGDPISVLGDDLKPRCWAIARRSWSWVSGCWSTLDTRKYKATVFISAPRSRPRHRASSSTPDPAEADS